MCDTQNLLTDEEMYLDGFKYDELVGMLGPGLDNNFLECVMGDLDQDESMMDINATNSISSFDNSSSFIDSEDISDSKDSMSPMGKSMSYSPNTSSVHGDPMLMQPLLTQYPSVTSNFVKTELPQISPTAAAPSPHQQAQPILQEIITPQAPKHLSPTLNTILPTPQPTIIVSNSGYCNIKPAPPRNTIPITNLTQFQSVKPIPIQPNNVSVVPQVVTVHGLSKEKQPIFVQNPTVMYTATKVQPVPSGGKNQSMNTFSNGNTFVLLDTADNKVPIHRVSIKTGRVGKRLAHNATEKKYRLSISSGIETLKNLVVGDDAKLQKSAILRKAVDFILHLQKQNRELRRQNAELIKGAKIGNVKDLLVPTGGFVKMEPDLEIYDAMTPPRSDMSNPSSSPSYSDNSMPSSPYSLQDGDSDSETSNPRGMAPHERLSLCVFMFAVIAFNPFGSFLSMFSGYSETFDDSGTRRNILSMEDDGYYSFSWQKFLLTSGVWLLNTIILAFCLVKMLVYGDPIMSTNTKTLDEFWKHKKHADVEFSKGNEAAAYRELNRCLQSYGLFLPTTRRECFTSTSWQFIRMLLHRVWIGKILSRRAGGLFCAADRRAQALNSAKELSLIYHRLNQISMTAGRPDPNGLLLSLYAVNMAEASAAIMKPANLVEIYLTAALRVKYSYPKLLKFFCRHYLGKAKQESAKLCGKIPTEFQWIFTPYGYKFFVNHEFNFSHGTLSGNDIFSCLDNKADPMSYVIKDYREHLLKKGLQCLVGTGQNNYDTASSNNGCRINEVLHYTQLLMDSIVNDSSVTFTSLVADRNQCKDKLAHWWASILSTVTYWILGDKETAAKIMEQVGKLPIDLYEHSDSLPKAFFVAFKAKSAIMIKSRLTAEEIFIVCNSGTTLLEESLKSNKCKNIKGMKLLIQFLACNWLLETRTALWEIEYRKNENPDECIAAPGNVMEKFQRDLNSLRIITENIANAESRVFLYEAIYRLMAGAAPGPTHELLNRNMTFRQSKVSLICGKDRTQDYDAGEREKADAIFIANKYLPTNLFSDSRVRRGLLMEAINILEKIGDKNKLDECNQLLSSIGS